MKSLVGLCLATLVFLSVAFAAQSSTPVTDLQRDPAMPRPVILGSRASTPHRPASRNRLDQGGDYCSDAFVIPSLPFCDRGTTVGYTDDDGACSGNSAPDVAYTYTPSVDQTVSISLCGSDYATDMIVWETDGNRNFGNSFCPNSVCGANGQQSCLSGLNLALALPTLLW